MTDDEQIQAIANEVQAEYKMGGFGGIYFDFASDVAKRFAAKLAEDARRYRWLLNHGGCPFAETDDAWLAPEALDEAIAQRMAQE